MSNYNVSAFSDLEQNLAINKMVEGELPFEKLTLKGLPNTPGAPAGYGDLASAINNIYKNAGAAKVGGLVSSIGALIQNKTLSVAFVLRAKPARMRVHFLNPASTAITGMKASIAVSDSIGDGFVPSGGVGSFRLLTVAATVPAATVNAGLASAVPADVKSDWFVPSCVDRIDGGSGYILMLRFYQDASSAGVRMIGGGINPTPPNEFSKYELVTGFSTSTGDYTTTSGAFTSNGAYSPPFWLEVDYETPIASVAIVGDSIMQGANGDPGNSSGAYGAAFQALQRINAAGKPCQLFNGGWSSAPTHGTETLLQPVVAGYLGQFMAYVDNGAKPSIAAFCPWSVNNKAPVYSASQQESVRQSIAVFIAFCNNNRIMPALVTPAPANGITAADESQRRACVQIIKNYCQQYGVLLIDRDGVYTNYELATGGYKLPVWCIDNTHPTAAGHAAESVEWEAKLNQVL